ncbi:MAG: hypothetical protein WC675_00125 [Patescibacteria group bacterium]|jgi:hypothetical protein
MKKKQTGLTETVVVEILEEMKRIKEIIASQFPKWEEEKQWQLAQGIYTLLHRQESNRLSVERNKVTKWRFALQILSNLVPWLVTLAAIFFK